MLLKKCKKKGFMLAEPSTEETDLKKKQDNHKKTTGTEPKLEHSGYLNQYDQAMRVKLNTKAWRQGGGVEGGLSGVGWVGGRKLDLPPAPPPLSRRQRGEEEDRASMQHTTTLRDR